MKLTRVIPLASLGLVAGIAIISSLHDEPLGMEFVAPPSDADLPGVDLGLGELVFLGQLVDESGAPVPDAGVTTEQAGRPLWTWTRKDGSFEFRELRPGPLLLRVVGLGFEASQFQVEPAENSVTAPEQAMEGGPAAGEVQVLTLDRPIGPPPQPPALRLGDLTGTVRFGPLAEPERGYELLLQPTLPPTDPAGGFPRRVPVATNGSFEVDLLHAGEYRAILLSPDEHGAVGPDLLAGARGEGRTFTHELGGDTPHLELVTTMGAISGRVVQTRRGESDGNATVPGAGATGADASPDRIAVRGALIRVERLVPASAEQEGPNPSDGGAQGEANPALEPDRATFRATRSGQEGAFELRHLRPGPYRLSVVAGRDRQSIDLVVPASEVVETVLDLSER